MSDEIHLGEDLAAFAGGSPELPAARRAALERHLEACPECRQAVAQARQIFAALEAMPATEASLGFDRALYARLDRLDAAGERTLAARIAAWLFRPAPLAGLAAAAAAVVAAVVLTGRPTEAPPAEVLLAAEVPEVVEIAENLELLRDLEVLEDLDVAEDLDLLSEIEEGEAG
jgi:anti-sigma factor RsiW